MVEIVQEILFLDKSKNKQNEKHQTPNYSIVKRKIKVQLWRHSAQYSADVRKKRNLAKQKRNDSTII